MKAVDAATTDPVDASGMMDRNTFITNAFVPDPLVQILQPSPIRVTVLMEEGASSNSSHRKQTIRMSQPTRQLFGTDGIRGVAGEFPLTTQSTYAIGRALGHDLLRANPQAARGDWAGHAGIERMDCGPRDAGTWHR